MAPNWAKPVPTIVVIGSSLLLEGVAASLANQQGLSVLRLTPPAADADAQHAPIWPAMIIFELDALENRKTVDRQELCRRPVLVGLDFAQDLMIVFNGKMYESPRTEDLLQIVSEIVGEPAPVGKEDRLNELERAIVMGD